MWLHYEVDGGIFLPEGIWLMNVLLTEIALNVVVLTQIVPQVLFQLYTIMFPVTG